MKMNRELEIFATTVYEIAKKMPDYYYTYKLETLGLVEKLIEQNSEYDEVYNEFEDDYEKKFTGYKNKEINELLQKIKTSLQKDDKSRKDEESKVENRFCKNVEVIKVIAKNYAIKTEDNK